jgi:mycoredoxin
MQYSPGGSPNPEHLKRVLLTMTKSSEQPQVADVTVYWRPGCPFCSTLRFGLRRTGLTYEEVNIWDDPDGAAFVRSVAGGNETVPTVLIGDTALVNPSARQVVEAATTSG